MLRSSSLGLAVAFLTTSITAQTSSARNLLPENPLATLHIDGPAALRAAFLPTNLGKLFAGSEFKEMIAPFMEMYEGLKEPAGGELPFDPSSLEAGILNYRGRLIAAFHLLDKKIDFNAVESPNFMVTIALTPDGKTDLVGLCKAVQELASETHGEQILKLTSDDKTIHYIDQGDEGSVTLPFMHKGHAVLLLTPNLQKAVDRLLDENTPHHQTEPRFGKSSMGVSIHARRIVELLTTGAKADERWTDLISHLFHRSGIESLESIDVTYRAFGPAVLSEVVVNFNQKDRGLIGVMMPNVGKKTALIDLLPRDAMQAHAMPLDFKKIYTVVKAAFDDLGEAAPMPFDEVLSKFKEEFGVRLKEDIFDTFGRGLIQVSMETEGGPSGGPSAFADGITVGFGMADGAVFAKTIDTMLRKVGLHAGRLKKEYKGFKVYDLNIAMVVQLHYVVTDDLFMIGIGDAGEANILATLDEVKRRADGGEAAALSKSVGERLKMVPGDWTGLGWTNLGDSMLGLADKLDLVASDLPPEFGGVIDVLETMPKLLKTYRVKHQVVVIRTDGNRWVYQNIW